MTDTDTTTEPAADTESGKYDNGNDQQMLHRLDGPFATKEMIQEAIDSGDAGPRAKRSSANEPYTPLAPVPDRFKPERFEALSDQPPPEQPPPEEPAS